MFRWVEKEMNQPPDFREWNDLERSQQWNYCTQVQSKLSAFSTG